ncbi:MAG TPA: hypothetical protein VGF55_20795, partial [Gemmataceae bacterium]
MNNIAVVYDSTNDVSTQAGKAVVDFFGAHDIGLSDPTELAPSLTQLKASGVRLRGLLFYNHGQPGGLIFEAPSKVMRANDITFHLAGKGLENLFLPGATILFPNCEVAAIEPGCDNLRAECAATDNGLVFLQTVAETLLFKSGGRVGGWDTQSHVVLYHLDQLFLGHHLPPFRFSGTLYWSIINRGGSLVRLAIGDELDSPYGSWEVNVDRQLFDYRFSVNPPV